MTALTKIMNNKTRLIIFDIDGVLLDSSHRYRTMQTANGEKLDLDHWRKNERYCKKDKPLELAEKYKKLLKQKNAFVIIATSRIIKSKDYRTIKVKLGLPHAIVSRNNNAQKGGYLKLNGVLSVMDKANLYNIKKIDIFEDNIEYLKTIADGLKNALNIQPNAHYVVSNQGH